MQEQRVRANDVEFSYLEAGPGDGPLALCLHGFPDTAHTWRHLLPELARAGYHAVAPWMRGYAPTAIPADGCYQTGALATDACALHDALGGDGRAVPIGHDWGAAMATGAAVHEPDRWRRVVTMALPPLAAMADSFFTYAQLKRSFYIFIFQTPLAETALSVDDHSFIDGLWADWSPGYNGAWDAARVKEAMGSPDNLSATIGYYRAMFDPSLHDPSATDALSPWGRRRLPGPRRRGRRPAVPLSGLGPDNAREGRSLPPGRAAPGGKRSRPALHWFRVSRVRRPPRRAQHGSA